MSTLGVSRSMTEAGVLCEALSLPRALSSDGITPRRAALTNARGWRPPTASPPQEQLSNRERLRTRTARSAHFLFVADAASGLRLLAHAGPSTFSVRARKTREKQHQTIAMD